MASQDLEKVDEIRRRLNASYEEALAGLEESGGDLLKALVAVEKKRKAAGPEPECEAIAERVMSLIQEGSVTGLRLKCGPRVIREMPVGWGGLGIAFACLLAVFMEHFSVELIKREPAQAPAGEAAAP